jgi:hypothetical protein
MGMDSFGQVWTRSTSPILFVGRNEPKLLCYFRGQAFALAFDGPRQKSLEFLIWKIRWAANRCCGCSTVQYSTALQGLAVC